MVILDQVVKAERVMLLNLVCNLGVLISPRHEHAPISGQNANLPLHHSRHGVVCPLSVAGDPKLASYTSQIEASPQLLNDKNMVALILKCLGPPSLR